MKYGSFLPLFTSSHAVITLFVSGLGPQLNTPILLTCNPRPSLVVRKYTRTPSPFDRGGGTTRRQITHVAVFLLDELQKRRHVRSAEMVHGLQSGEHAHFTQSLEVVFTNVLSRDGEKKNDSSIKIFCYTAIIIILANKKSNTTRVRTNMVVRKSNLWKN